MTSDKESIPYEYGVTATYYYENIVFEVEPVFRDEGNAIDEIILRLTEQDLKNRE